MSIFKRYNLKAILFTAMWIGLASMGIVLLAAAVKARGTKLCKGLEVEIHGVSNNFFIDKEDVKKVIASYAGDDLTTIEVNEFNLVAMEAELNREVWIKKADLFFDNNNVLQAYIEEREPIARVFTSAGSTFYIDDTNMMLPLSDKISARVPVFTNFPTENKVLSKKDSSLLVQINNLSTQIQKDSFLMAMIDQIDITRESTFEMVPKIGDHIIVFGDGTEAEKKFRKLKLFYKKVMAVNGWGKYSVINLQYKDQVVGKIRGRDDFSEDSLRTIEIMQELAANSARAASDSIQVIIQDNEKNSSDFSMIQQSMEREDGNSDLAPAIFIKKDASQAVTSTPALVPAPKKKVVAKATPSKEVSRAAPKSTSKKIEVKKKTTFVKKKSVPVINNSKAIKPKVVMPKKNDY